MGLNAADKVGIDAIATLRGRVPVVYGAGSAGGVIVKLLAEAGIAVACCIDKNAAVIGRLDGVPVHAPEHLAALAGNDDLVLIVAVNSEHAFHAIGGTLAEKFPQLPAPIWGRTLIDAFAVRRCEKRLADGLGLDLRDCMGCRADPAGCKAFRRGAQSVAVGDAGMAGNSALDDFAYFVTNRCTLNCAHCVEALPYYARRTTETGGRILEAVRKTVQACGFVHRFSVTGGEPLLNKELPDILDALLAMPGIGYIFVYTTGTVVPNDRLAACLAHPRIAVNVSDYGSAVDGKLRTNLDRFLGVLDRHRVAYCVLGNKVWFDLGRFERLDLDVDVLRTSFANCAFTNCMTIADGVLYRCPHQLAGMRLGQLPAIEGETVDIDRLAGPALVAALDRFVDLDVIDACGCCRLSAGAHEVPAAVQLPRRLSSATTI